MVGSRRKSAAALVSAIVTLGFASPAAAQVPTLQGEVFQGSGFIFDDPFNTGPSQPPGCDPNGTSTFHMTRAASPRVLILGRSTRR